VRDRSNRIAARLHAWESVRATGLRYALPTSGHAATYLGVLRTGAVLVTMSRCGLISRSAIGWPTRVPDILVSEAATHSRTSDFTGITLDVDVVHRSGTPVSRGAWHSSTSR